MGVQPSVRQIGKYVVIDVIGQGGMGIVYRASDPAIGRTVAIKMLKQSAVENPGSLLERFFSREMRSTASLNHKNIVTVYDSGDMDGNPYLVMEYLEGEPASKIISERQPMALVEKLDIVVQTLDGLQYAHDREIVHRDIKPANVIRLSDGTVKIVDFGVSRIAGTETSLVQTGQLVGSLSYMSPEQINSLPIDGRSDIFSTGVMLYELLTYVLPFKASDPGATFVKILREEPEPLSKYIKDLPATMQGVLNRALAKKAGDRYQSAEEFGFDLLQVQKELKDITIADCMKRADGAVQRGDLERARLHLQEVIKLDRQHERANRLLREVRKSIQLQQRASQVTQMRSQAQVALAGNQYEEALACADQALRLDPNDQESTRLCEDIRTAITRAKAVREALNRAETATFAGDFDEAKEAIEESLRLAPSDMEARALALLVNKELAERSRRLQVQEFVDSARRGIAERDFNQAIHALHRAEQLDPSDSNVRELLQWAERGQEQERRRRDLEEITEQIDKALHAGDFSSACTISDMGLLRFPEEPTLTRLRAISEKQRDIAERRSFVHDQSLAVKVLSEQEKFGEAMDLLSEALRRYPGEPNLESLMGLTRSEIERHTRLREESLRQEALQRAEAEAKAARRQQMLTWAVELRAALDARGELDAVMATSQALRHAVSESQVEDEHATEVAKLVLQEIDAKVHTRDQVLEELEQLEPVIAEAPDPASIAEAENRLLNIKAAYPHETRVQNRCEPLAAALEQIRLQREEAIAALTAMAQHLDKTAASQLHLVFQNARAVAGRFAADPRIGALLQQIEYAVARRLQLREERIRDLHGLSADVVHAHSMAELARATERGRAIAALDASDDGLAAQFAEFEAETRQRHTELAGILHELQALAGAVTGAATVTEAERLVGSVAELGERHSGFQDLQEGVTRVRAEAQGRRMEHDLIVEELQSLRSSIPLLSSTEELTAMHARTAECRTVHAVEPAICTLCDQVDEEAAAMVRGIEERKQRHVACDQTIERAGNLLRDQHANEALALLLESEALNPDREDLRAQISVAREKISFAAKEKADVEARAEQLRLEEERAQQARAEKARQEAERAEKERVKQLQLQLQKEREERERAEEARAEQLRLQKEREEKERIANARLEQERAEAARAEQLRLQKEREEQEQAEKARLEQERAEAARVEQLRLQKEREEQEQAEKTRLEQVRADAARAEQLRLQKEREEQDRVEKARLEQERAEAARAEQLRLQKEREEKERAEKARLEQERAEAARAEQLRLQKEREEKERGEKARLEQERADAARAEQLRQQKEREEKERAEKARLAQERAEVARAEQLRQQKEREEKERAEKARLAQERADAARTEQLRLQKEHEEKERVEQARLAQERAEKARAEQVRLQKEREEKERVEQARLEKERADRARAARLRELTLLRQEVAGTSTAAGLAGLSAQVDAIAKANANDREVAKAAKALQRTIRQTKPAEPVVFPAPVPQPKKAQPASRQKPAAIMFAVLAAVVLLGAILLWKVVNRPRPVAVSEPPAAPRQSAPPPTPLTPATPGATGSVAILAAMEGANVFVDGQAQGAIAAHRVDLAGLSPGPHVVKISANNRDLSLQVNVGPQTTFEVTGAHGMDEQLVVSLGQAAGRKVLFCRCPGAEVRIDGKLLRPAGRDQYQLRDQHQSAQQVLLTVGKEKRQITLAQSGQAHGLIVIENALVGNTAKTELAKAPPAAAPVNQASATPPAQTPAVTPSPAPSLTTSPATAAKTEDPAAAAWSGIQSTTDLSVLRSFRDKYPGSSFARLAADRMEAISWESARKTSQPGDLERFLKDYPKSEHVEEARTKLASLANGDEENNQQQQIQQDRDAVLQVLNGYKAAYEAKDVNRLAAAWPGAPRQRLQDTFKAAGKIRVALETATPNINGENATVAVIQRLEIQSQGTTSSNKSAIVFVLKRVQGKWVIDNLK